MSEDQFTIPESNFIDINPSKEKEFNDILSEEKILEPQDSTGMEYIDPAELEAKMMKEAQDRMANSRPEDVASEFFRMYFPVYRNLLSGLSNKDARRVAEHVVQWPLEDEKPHFNEKRAEEAFHIGVRLVDAKMVMRVHVEMENHKAQQAKIEEEKQKQATETVVKQGEEENGNEQTKEF